MSVASSHGRRPARRIPLAALLVTLAVLSVAIGFAYALFASYQVQKAQAIKNTLAYSRSYADKLADVVNLYIHAMHGQLLASASKVSADSDNQTAVAGEMQRVLQQADGAVAVLFSDVGGNVTASATKSGGKSPRMLADLGVSELRAGEWVSVVDPAVPTLTLVEPVNNATGIPQGYLAMVVALGNGLGIAQVLGKADDASGMAVYVVNRTGDVLYRQQAESLPSNLKGLSHSAHGWAAPLVADDGGTLLTGYAPVAKGNWAIVTQRPLDQALLPVRGLLADALRSAAPVVLFMLLAVSALAYAIASPLSRLSRALAAGQGKKEGLGRLNAWYAEADTLRGAVEVSLEHHHQQMKRLNLQSMTDPLTGLMNRRALDDALADFKTDAVAVAVIALDLDHFKRINDTFGHACGDQVLIAVADVLRHSLRDQDTPYRVGGEEFIALLPADSAEVARDVAERIRAALSAHAMPEGMGKVTASVGIARWPKDGADLDSVLQRADEALYASKKSGRDRVTFWADAATPQRGD